MASANGQQPVRSSARLLAAFFGVSGWGRVLVPINFRLQPPEIEYIVDHSGASVLLIDPELADDLAHTVIDLGDVYEVATLTLDGQTLGTRICPPVAALSAAQEDRKSVV